MKTNSNQSKTLSVYQKKETTIIPHKKNGQGINYSAKQGLLIMLLLFFYSFNYGQINPSTDKVIMNDGTILQGKISENLNTDYLSIETTEGKTLKIKYTEIKEFQMAKPEVDLSIYGGDISIGAAVGGGGLIGLPIRYFITEKMPVEAGIHLRPIVDDDFYWNILITGTYNYYFNKKLKKYKNRVQMNGLFLNGGYHFGKEYNGTMVGFGWAYERFKLQHKNYSVSFELGWAWNF
ncbi:MAG: hypothetical protein R2764_03375 [Bacteroidales bacterium]